MRYRIGSNPEQARQELDGMIVGSAMFGFFIGVIFVIAGMRGRQIWLSVWGAGLVLASSAYLIYTLIR